MLAQTGVLDGRTATTHWAVAKVLAERFPRISVNPDVLYVDHVRERGKELFEWACAWDLEGIVAKRADSRYEFTGRRLSRSPWLKIKNKHYTQKDGREELFERKRNLQASGE